MTTVKDVMGKYELRIAIINLDDVENSEIFRNVELSRDMEGREFYTVAEMLGTVYSLGTFVEHVNEELIDNLTNSYIHAYLIDTEDPETDPISVEDFNTLYVIAGSIRQV